MLSHSPAPSRLVGIDLLRVFAILCVSLNHCTEELYSLELEPLCSLPFASRLFALAAFTLGRLGVPCFFMITGYLLLDRSYSPEQSIRFWKSNCLHLLLCTLAWFSLYDLLLYVCGQTITPTEYLTHILFLAPTTLVHTWYMPAILGLYVLLPVLANGLKQVPSRILAGIIAVFFFYAFIIPGLNVLLYTYGLPTVSVTISFGFSGGAYGIYLLLGVLVKRGALRRIPAPFLLLVLLLSYGGTTAFQLFCYSMGTVYNVWYDFPLLPIAGICLLELFSRLQTLPVPQMVYHLSCYAFGVYLIHNVLVYFLHSWCATLPLIHPLQVIFLFCIVVPASYLIAFGIGRIPKIGRYLLYLKPLPASADRRNP